MTETKQPTQTITYDDFEKSLEHDGIEIIIPEEEEEKPEGVGASGYVPRKVAPSNTNPYYLKYGRGGYNRCILISGNSCLPNCVGYAYGRTLEIGGRTSNPKLPTCNAEDWFATAKANGFATGSTPRLGAVIVWKSGNLLNGNDGCGHVGIVERIFEDGSIYVSQSNYGGTRFYITQIKKPYSIYGQQFLGFIYNPYYAPKAEWHKDGTGWWYEHADGSYPKNAWEKIDGKWYYFNGNGYMATGWIKDKSKWYYLGTDGAMYENRWMNYNGKFYYLGADGAMLTGKHTLPCSFDENGAFKG